MSKGKPLPLYVLRPYGWSEQHRPLHCLQFFGQYLLIGSEGGQIFSYNLKTLRTEKSFLPNLGSSCVQLLRSDCRLVTQNKLGDVSLWQQHEGDTWIRESNLDTKHTGFCRTQLLEVEGLSQTIACATSNSDITLYSIGEGKFIEICQLKSPESGNKQVGIVTCLSTAGADKVVTLYESNVMYLWDIRQSSEPSSSFEMKDVLEDSIPVTVDFDVHTSRGVYGGMTDELGTFITDGLTLKQHKTKYPLKMTNKGALNIVIQPTEFATTKSRIMAVGCCDGSLRVYSWSTGRLLAVMLHSNDFTSVHDVAFSPDPLDSLNSERVIAAAGADGCVSLWNSDFTRKV